MTEELVSYTTKDLADIDLLMHELSATSYCDETLAYDMQWHTPEELAEINTM